MRATFGFLVAALIGGSAIAGEFRPAGRPQHGYGRYRVSIAIVEGVDDPSVLARQLSGTYGGKIESVAEAGAMVRMTERSARMWSEHPRVVVVEEIVADNGNETWTTGTYNYDGAGNIKSIDTTKFTYDAFGRLTKGGSGGGHHQSYTYDNYGNILTVTTDGNTSTQLKPGVDPATNRISRNTSAYNVWGQYDAAGRMTSYQDTQTFVYDAVDMIKESTVNGTRRLYLYTPRNERLAAITVDSNGQEIYSTWTVRETSGQVIRRFTRTGGTWRWDQDYIHREGQLLAAELPGSVRRYFHLDHLGTPRVITNGNGTKVALHNYYPFGLEETSPLQDSEVMKFTGHERDATFLDHMHARSYLPGVGRFLSPDTADDYAPSAPQTWNRYSYVRGDPVNQVDPTGMFSMQITVQARIINPLELYFMGRLFFTEFYERQQAAKYDGLLASANAARFSMTEKPFATYEECELAGACFDPEQLLTFVGGAPRITARTLMRSGLSRFNAEYTNVGRALTKHPEVIGLTKANVRSVLRSDAAVNKAASGALKEIIRHGKVTTPLVPRYGQIIQVQVPGGFGARWRMDGTFIGFISP